VEIVEIVSLFTFYNYNIDKFIFTFNIFSLILKLSDWPPESMDIHILYDHDNEEHETDSREDRDSEAIANRYCDSS